MNILSELSILPVSKYKECRVKAKTFLCINHGFKFMILLEKNLKY